MKINKINNKNICIKRRSKGEFFTPTIWVDEAHKMIEENLGKDWKEKYVVWDPAWGTGNLTRDYKFKELYCSTIEASDIHTANQMGYNPEAIKFQYDFLNDGVFPNPETGELEISIDLDTKMPQGLKEAIKQGKPIVVLMNPPYATTANFGGKNKEEDGNDTIVNCVMKKEGMGRCSDSLYGQFLYKLIEYQKIDKNINIGVFCPSLFLSGSSYKNFRIKLNNSFKFNSGFIFDASHFANVSSKWGITFSFFDNYSIDIKPIYNVLDINNGFEVVSIGKKQIYNLDDLDAASDWVRKEVKGVKTFDSPQMKSALNINSTGKGCRGNLTNNSFGFFYNNSNNVDKNTQNVGIFTSCFSSGTGCSIIKENFYKITTLFTARKCIMPNWINSKDEYLAPNDSHPKFEQFKYDSLVYSLFNNSSQQSSLRQVEYKGKLWDIKNEFFWLSAEKMKMLAEENSFDALYKDARTSNERYVYELLFGEQDIYNKLSPDAKAVLDAATALLEKSMSMRKAMSEGKPEYHLQTWDAGYAQLKLVWKQYFKNEFDAFRKLYKQFEDRMRPLVYELGFLLGDDNIIK